MLTVRKTATSWLTSKFGVWSVKRSVPFWLGGIVRGVFELVMANPFVVTEAALTTQVWMPELVRASWIAREVPPETEAPGPVVFGKQVEIV